MVVIGRFGRDGMGLRCVKNRIDFAANGLTDGLLSD